jgi:N-acyl-L-homoserine lactone synthetase
MSGPKDGETKVIEIVQTGQFGKTKSLIEMHRVRKFIFKDRMQWNVDITQDGLEIDDYDLPETVYLLARNTQNNISGVWRILSSESPSMIRNIWPEFLNDFHYPINNRVWEASRFGVFGYEDGSREHIRQVNQITATLICGLIQACILADISHIYTLYNPQVGRSVRKIGFIPEKVSQELLVDGKPSIVGCFRMDEEALNRVQKLTGITAHLTAEDLPPILKERFENKINTRGKILAHA